MFLSIVETANLTDWTIQIDNNKIIDNNNRAIIQLIKDAYFGSWNSWSSCSKVRFEPRTKKSESSDFKTVFHDDLIEKPDHFPDHFSSICHYPKSQFGNNFQKNF